MLEQHVQTLFEGEALKIEAFHCDRFPVVPSHEEASSGTRSSSPAWVRSCATTPPGRLWPMPTMSCSSMPLSRIRSVTPKPRLSFCPVFPPSHNRSGDDCHETYEHEIDKDLRKCK